MKKNLLSARSCPFTMQPVSGREKTEIPNPPPLERMAVPQKKSILSPSFFCLFSVQVGMNEDGIISAADSVLN